MKNKIIAILYKYLYRNKKFDSRNDYCDEIAEEINALFEREQLKKFGEKKVK